MFSNNNVACQTCLNDIDYHREIRLLCVFYVLPIVVAHIKEKFNELWIHSRER